MNSIPTFSSFCRNVITDIWYMIVSLLYRKRKNKITVLHLSIYCLADALAADAVVVIAPYGCGAVPPPASASAISQSRNILLWTDGRMILRKDIVVRNFCSKRMRRREGYREMAVHRPGIEHWAQMRHSNSVSTGPPFTLASVSEITPCRNEADQARSDYSVSYFLPTSVLRPPTELPDGITAS